jgi:hypothetical protein
MEFHERRRNTRRYEPRYHHLFHLMHRQRRRRRMLRLQKKL